MLSKQPILPGSSEYNKQVQAGLADLNAAIEKLVTKIENVSERTANLEKQQSKPLVTQNSSDEYNKQVQEGLAGLYAAIEKLVAKIENVSERTANLENQQSRQTHPAKTQFKIQPLRWIEKPQADSKLQIQQVDTLKIQLCFHDLQTNILTTFKDVAENKRPRGVNLILTKINQANKNASWEKTLPEIKKIATHRSNYTPVKRFFIGQADSTVAFYKDIISRINEVLESNENQNLPKASK